jgi:hypothetical protein
MIASPPLVPAKTGCWVVLDRASPFAPVFPGREAPVTHYLPRPAGFERDPRCCSGWQLDWARCTEAQRTLLLVIFADREGGGLELIAEEIRRTGVGIRATSVALVKDYDTGRTLMA